MNHKSILFFLLVITAMLSGCISGTSVPMTDSNTSKLMTLTVTPKPSTTPTLTLLPTLEPVQAEEAIRALLQEPDGCPAPCFWDIVPEKTTLEEATSIFTHLGLPIQLTNTRDNKDFYGVTYTLESGLSITVILTIQDDIVKDLRVSINPEKYQPSVPKDWITYSPETLISRYGTPSNVEFFVGRAAPMNTYSIVMYFDTVDMIIEYYGNDLPFNNGSFIMCPLNSGFDDISMWLGANPEKPPLVATPLEEATSMSLEKFAELMTGDPQNACFTLREDAFP